MRKTILIVCLFVIFLTTRNSLAQTGDIAVNTGDELSYRISDIYDSRGPTAIYGVQVEIGDFYIITILNIDYETDNVFEIEVALNGETIETTNDVTKLSYVTIPDWTYWEDLITSEGGYFEVDENNNIIIAFAYLEGDTYVYVGLSYSLEGIKLAEYIEFAPENKRDTPYFYVFSILDSEVGVSQPNNYVFNTATSISRGDKYEYKVTLLDSDLNVPFYANGNDELYLFEDDQFTVEVGSLPNSKDEISLRIKTDTESIVIIQKMINFGSYFLYADTDTWLEIADDAQADLDSGEFLDYTIGDEFELHYLYTDHTSYYEMTVVYNEKTWILQYYELEVRENGGGYHFIIEIVKNSEDKKGFAINGFLLFSGMISAVLIKKHKTKHLE